jgi:hypothetical protein
VAADLLAGAAERILYTEHLEGDGPQIRERACAMGLEGIVSKQQDTPYRSGRVESWIKVKCGRRDAFPIVAFVEKLGAKPRKIASFYVGRREGDRLLYAGKVRGGFTEAEARELRERLDPFIRKDAPLSEPVDKPKATWVEPVLEAEGAFSTVTENALLREAVFKGLREDGEVPPAHRRARTCRRTAGDRHRTGVPRENILQLLPDAVTPTKEELRAYWANVWKRALPHLGRRPLKLVRHVRGTTFYQKGKLPPVPDPFTGSRSKSAKAARDRYRLSFDLQTPWWHLAEAAELARDFPETLIVLNHTGLPADRSAERPRRLAPGHADARRRAQCRGQNLGPRSTRSAVDGRGSTVRDAIAIFGVDRCMFASNFPSVACARISTRSSPGSRRSPAT